MMYSYSMPLLVVALTAAVAANPVAIKLPDEDYSISFDNRNIQDQVIMPQKRAALVLDRLLIALQKALHEEAEAQRINIDRDGPRTAPLRYVNIDTNDMTGLQRRGQGSRGRVLRCYFNAVTCF